MLYFGNWVAWLVKWFSLSAWLPNTHGNLLKKYKKDITVVGTNLSGVKTGLACTRLYGGEFDRRALFTSQ